MWPLSHQVTFECKSPYGGNDRLMLKGLNCYEAATHCAAISAAKRVVGEEVDTCSSEWATALSSRQSGGGVP